MDRVGIRFDEAEELGEILVPFDRVEALVGPQLVIAVQVDTGAVQDHGRHFDARQFQAVADRHANSCASQQHKNQS